VVCALLCSGRALSQLRDGDHVADGLGELGVGHEESGDALAVKRLHHLVDARVPEAARTRNSAQARTVQVTRATLRRGYPGTTTVWSEATRVGAAPVNEARMISVFASRVRRCSSCMRDQWQRT